uniref:Uncharacterized protein n=1 Tax=Arundo donax TaxID=35708 RepID=A0A0A9Q3D1_ARUDO
MLSTVHFVHLQFKAKRSHIIQANRIISYTIREDTESFHILLQKTQSFHIFLEKTQIISYIIRENT